MKEFDDIRDKLLKAVYDVNTGARENKNFSQDLIESGMGNFATELKEDAVLQNTINDNMRVAGKNLSTYDEFKADNKELKIQNSQTHGGKS